jgi:hypothetical protein
VGWMERGDENSWPVAESRRGWGGGDW